MPRVPNQLTKVAKTVTLKTTTRASITPLINSTHTHLININTTTVSSSSTSSLSSLSSYTTFPQRQFSPLNTTSIPSTTNTTSPLVSSSSSQSSQNGIIHRSLFTTPASSTGMEINVSDNNTDIAMKRLKRKLIKEGFVKEIRNRRFCETPSEQRVRINKEQTRRIQRKKLKEKIRWIMWKRYRGF
eukprot:TRINITY_DN10426_c0_g1_i3.p1 TRINITY_DN10426_c0_g1~~TRINITY_DN10426_c0_g1_i3.p1  ORF type:complete len:186 (+),score=64.51 TRINITY_DN10426_c0_g1_i3:55-612(+)